MNLNTRILGLVFGLLMVSSVSGMAQDSLRRISLDEAIGLSIKNSKALRASRARVDQATAVLREA